VGLCSQLKRPRNCAHEHLILSHAGRIARVTGMTVFPVPSLARFDLSNNVFLTQYDLKILLTEFAGISREVNFLTAQTCCAARKGMLQMDAVRHG
jgi:hypothetical protein